MSDELKPCPFCGNDDVFNRENGFGQNLTGCNKCGARTYYKFNSLDDAAKAWNTRPIEDALRTKLDDVKSWLGNIKWVLGGEVTPEIIANLRSYVSEALQKLEEK